MKRPPLQVPIAVVVGSMRSLCSLKPASPCARAAPLRGARARARTTSSLGRGRAPRRRAGAPSRRAASAAREPAPARRRPARSCSSSAIRSARSWRPSPRSSGSAARKRAVELERGVREAALVEVQARAQRELLAQQRVAARAEQRREALLRAQRRRARGRAGRAPRRHGAARLASGSSRACSQRPSATCSPSPQPALITSAWAGRDLVDVAGRPRRCGGSGGRG